MTDALSKFDFSKVTGGGLFVKFVADRSITIRVLTVDPVVVNEQYEDKETGDISLTTKFAFIIYNFTDDKAQILKASPNMASNISKLHTDEDFGADIRKLDIKITPTGEKLQRRYDIQVLPKANTLTNEQIKECKAIDLDAKVENGQRMSFYKPIEEKVIEDEGEVDVDLEEETPIDLNDIPF